MSSQPPTARPSMPGGGEPASPPDPAARPDGATEASGAIETGAGEDGTVDFAADDVHDADTSAGIQPHATEPLPAVSRAAEGIERRPLGRMRVGASVTAVSRAGAPVASSRSAARASRRRGGADRRRRAVLELPSARRSSATEGAVATSLATVERRSISSQQTENGTLGYAGSYTVINQAGERQRAAKAGAGKRAAAAAAQHDHLPACGRPGGARGRSASTRSTANRCCCSTAPRRPTARCTRT